MKGLAIEDRVAWEHQRVFLDSIETTAMTKSYKMLVLLAMMQSEAFGRESLGGGSEAVEIEIGEIVQLVRRMADRSSVLRGDLGESHLKSDVKLRKHLVDHPIKAWTNPGSVRRNGEGGTGKVYFEYRDGVFRWIGGDLGPHRDRFAELLRELVDWRLAEYLDRGTTREGYLCRIIRSGKQPIIKLPRRTGKANIPTDWISVEIEGKAYVAKFVQQYINVVRDNLEAKENALGQILRDWYGPSVGQPGTRFEVELVQLDNAWHIRKV
jgi:hypothetical protein